MRMKKGWRRRVYLLETFVRRHKLLRVEPALHFWRCSKIERWVVWKDAFPSFVMHAEGSSGRSNLTPNRLDNLTYR